MLSTTSKYDAIIGIDPGAGINNVGVAIWLPGEKRFESIFTTSMHGLITSIDPIRAPYATIVFRIEDCRKESNIFKAETTYNLVKAKRGHVVGLRSALKIARSVGMLDGGINILIEELDMLKIPYELVSPSVRKKGIDLKLSQPLFERRTKCTIKTNEHGRDAAMLVFGRK